MRRLPWACLSLSSLLTLILCVLFFSTLVFAATPDRITAPIVAANTIRLATGVPMQAKPEFDQGAVDSSLELSYITLMTVPSVDQQEALTQLLADQQDKSSPLYHQWLTPEQYADRFGLSPNDIQKITAWLQSQGFTIVRTARSRNWIAFSGTAGQVESAFQTQIHSFKVNGELHFANATPPAIPASLSGIVTGLRGLDDFRPKSQARRADPSYTFADSGSNYHFISPGDIAAIYDINTLYSNGYNGTGQKLVVVGQTGVYQSDLTNFRQSFGLSAISCTTSSDIITACNTSNFKYVLVNGSATTIHSGDLGEADLDIEWSGATARNAQIIYVTAPSTSGSGVWDSLDTAVTDNLAPVITMSYTTPCELAAIGYFDYFESILQQANSQGITVLNSSGDTSAAECDYGANIAVYGYAVAYPASSQYVTSVGGTSIPTISPNEYSSTYWNTSNGTNGVSAKGYIPEQVWNDAEEYGLVCSQASPPAFCSNNLITNWATSQTYFGLSGGGGGVSNCVTADTNYVCLSGFPQPSWQAGLNVSAVNPGGIGEISSSTPTRYSPDVSLLASANLPGYLVCTHSGSSSSCDSPTTGITDMLNACFAGTGSCTIYGGTSVSTPVFAGMVALLNQDVVASGLQATPGLGNINPTLYSLAAKNSTNGAFNPVTTPSTGAYSNGVFCTAGTPTGQPVALQCPSGGFLGFEAYNSDPTTGYNLVTGLGSVNASHLAAAWVANTATTTTTVTSNLNPANLGDSVTFTATVARTVPGTPVPTGTVTFKDGTTTLGTGTLATVGSDQEATFTTSTLTVGTHSITAVYGGDDDNAASTSSVLSQVINGDATTTTLVSSLNPADQGVAVTFTATVGTAGSHPPTGTVTFKDGGTSIGTGTLNGSLMATFTTSTLTIGTHSITAVYGGDSYNSGSTSSTVNQVIAAVTTTTTVASSLNPAQFGASVIFTATVARSIAGTPAPTGTVTFKDGTTTLGTGTLATVGSDQEATFTTSTLTVGTHSITAVYAGDAYNSGSTSSTLSQVIDPLTFTFVSSGSASHTVLAGQTSMTYTFTATPTSGTTFVNAVNLACSFSPTDTTLTSSTCSYSVNGGASQSGTATIPAGTGTVPVTMTVTTAGPNTGTGSQLRHHADNRLPWLPLTFPLAGIVMVGFAGRKLSKYSMIISLCLVLALVGLLVACGSSSIGVSVSGSSASIYPQNSGWTNSTATFTATLTNDSGSKGVTWAVSATGSGSPGTIVATDATHATYTPPTIAAGLTTPITVTATSVADTSKKGTASIALTPTTVPNNYTVTVTATETGATATATPHVTLVVN